MKFVLEVRFIKSNNKTLPNKNKKRISILVCVFLYIIIKYYKENS